MSAAFCSNGVASEASPAVVFSPSTAMVYLCYDRKVEDQDMEGVDRFPETRIHHQV